jgi:hypothetical protein
MRAETEKSYFPRERYPCKFVYKITDLKKMQIGEENMHALY